MYTYLCFSDQYKDDLALDNIHLVLYLQKKYKSH